LSLQPSASRATDSLAGRSSGPLWPESESGEARAVRGMGRRPCVAHAGPLSGCPESRPASRRYSHITPTATAIKRLHAWTGGFARGPTLIPRAGPGRAGPGRRFVCCRAWLTRSIRACRREPSLRLGVSQASEHCQAVSATVSPPGEIRVAHSHTRPEKDLESCGGPKPVVSSGSDACVQPIVRPEPARN
jgi:hypothetical protein